jgi:hypothetical protein
LVPRTNKDIASPAPASQLILINGDKIAGKARKTVFFHRVISGAQIFRKKHPENTADYKPE